MDQRSLAVLAGAMASSEESRELGAGEGRLLRAGEVAQMVGVSRQAIQARARRGSLRAVKVDGEWRIPEEVARAMVRAELEKGVSSGQVRSLGVAVGDAEPAEARMQELLDRIGHLEELMARRDEELGAVLRSHAEQLASRDKEIEQLRQDRRRLRAALRELLVDDDGR